MFDFRDRVVVITGAAGNLGFAVASAFYGAGARVAVVDRRRDAAAEIFGEEIPEGEFCLYVAGDVTDESSVGSMVQQVMNRFNRIDVLVNIAGGYRAGEPLHATEVATWDHMMNLNARTVFLMSRAVIPHMLQRRYGKIISISARAALKGTAGSAAYVASKMAVIRLTESMAEELRDEGINVNCILPGTLDTPANRRGLSDDEARKLVSPDSLAGVIQFLASDLARDIHGAAVPVYGLT